MFGVVDLVWKPSLAYPTPPVGQGPAFIRNDTYSHTFRFTDGVLNGFDTWTWIAQVRRTRLIAGATAGTPAAAFSVVLTPDTDDLLVTIGLATATTTTLSLPSSGGFWDMQLSKAGVVTTWLSGKAKILDDVSRS